MRIWMSDDAVDPPCCRNRCLFSLCLTCYFIVTQHLLTCYHCPPLYSSYSSFCSQTLSNLADAQVALGEAALAAGQAAEGQAAFESALQSYQASCALNDSASGEW